MKLVTFVVQTPVGAVNRLGAILDDGPRGRIADLHAAHIAYLERETDEPTPHAFATLRVPPDMVAWLRAGREGRREAEHALAHAGAHADAVTSDGARLVYNRAEVRLLSPLPKPQSFRDFSIYEEHMAAIPKLPIWYTNPIYYKGSTTAFCGPEDPVPWPYYTKTLDLELEIGIVVGRYGRDLTFEQAEECIAGYAILVDSSCREGRDREPLGPTKRKDWHTALGPFLATRDEVDIEHLHCSLAVDGEVWFDGSTAAPHAFSPAQLVAYVSDQEAVFPGDLIGTGTIGASCSPDSGRWIQVGQKATFTVEGLGSMTLEVVERAPTVRHVGSGMQGQLSAPSSAGASGHVS
jgi:2-keto-4-pentenoate hydratase/2-oxohepta-3-ene-1,7-dioic acid hydratase in catechol pathway